MSTFIELDSKFRNRNEYSNPGEFIIDSSQTNGWSSLIRNTQCVTPCMKSEVCNLLFCIKLNFLMIPIRTLDAAGNTINFITLDAYNNPVTRNNNVLYVQFNSSRYNDSGLIRTINNNNTDAVFIAYPYENIISSTVGGQAIEWIKYKCDMQQCIRIDDVKPVLNFRIFTNQKQDLDGPFSPILGGPLPGFKTSSSSIRIYGDDTTTTPLPLSDLQIKALLELTPYIREGRYDNNLMSIWRDN